MKKIICILLAITTLALFAGCSSSSKEVSLATVLDDINTQCNIDAGSMKSITTSSDMEKYFYISPDDMTDFVAETASESSAITKVIIVKTDSEDSADNVLNALNTIHQSALSNAQSYEQSEVDTITACSPQKTAVGDAFYVSLIICEDYETANDVYSSALK